MIPAREILEYESGDPEWIDLNPVTPSNDDNFDINDDVEMLWPDVSGPDEGPGLFNGLSLRRWRHSLQPIFHLYTPKHYEPIKCTNILPTWDLPKPFDISSFTELLGLCAAVFSHGWPRGNAGLICLKKRDGPHELIVEDWLAQ
ncbi:MAG: hypothetical protein M1814_002562 [Vezdaea aestivalis]|nr:MAG: hypothetical protein M1814_002562 [Vezdaea aestivalis]